MFTEDQTKITTDWLDNIDTPYRIEDGGVIVSGGIKIPKDTELYLPALAKSGSVYVGANATFNAPALVTVKHLAYETEFLGHSVEVFDGIGTVTQRTKLIDGITIRKCRKATFKKGHLAGDLMYVVSRGGRHAHGETIKQAIADLAFKEADKDASKYRGMPLETEKSTEDWIVAYRVVTGSCSIGVQEFIKQQGVLKRTYTLAEVLELTTGQYQATRFRELVTQ